jgi:YVTN family beta-propeller protein
MRPRPAEGFLAALLLVASMGCRPSRGTAVEGYAFVASAGSSSIAVVDLASFSVRRRMPLRARPVQLVSDPRRRSLYVMGDGGTSGLTVIDAAALDVKRSMWLAEQPQRMLLAPDGSQLYIIDTKPPLFKALALETLSHGRQIPLPSPPVDFDVSPDGRWACVSLESGEAAVLNLAGWKLAGRVPAGDEPAAVAIRHDSRQAFVASRGDRSISVIDLASARLLARLPMNTKPAALRFKPDGGELLVSGADSSAVVILSAYRDEVDQPVLAGAAPRDLAVTKDNRLLFVANSAANTVSVINLEERQPVASVPVGEEPHRVALTPDDQYALVLNYKSGDMAVIRAAAVLRGSRNRIQPVFTVIPVGSQPVDLAVQAR